MSQYLVLKDVVKDCEIFGISRNNDVVQYIIDNYQVGYNEYTRIEDVDDAIEDINGDISKAEARLDAMLIKRHFDIEDYTGTKEYLVELYETRGRLYLINTILYDNKNVQMIYA